MRTELGPKQLQWCRDKWPAFRSLEEVTTRIREEANAARSAAARTQPKDQSHG